MRAIPVVTIIAICLSACASKSKLTGDPLITVLDIGNNDRLELGRQLRVVNNMSPKVIGLDFHLVPDSLDKDSILVKEFARAHNLVQVCALHEWDYYEEEWDSLEISNRKFRPAIFGFGNFNMEDHWIFDEHQPLVELFEDTLVFTFSYQVAQHSFGVRSRYRQPEPGEEYTVNVADHRTSYRIISLKNFNEGKYSREDFNNKIVLLGYTGLDEDGFYVNSRARENEISGVELHAIMVSNIIDRQR